MWKCADRDAFLGWDRAARESNLQHLTNNTCFLVPSWVHVPHLASHVLGVIARRIRSDWQAKYGHLVQWRARTSFATRRRLICPVAPPLGRRADLIVRAERRDRVSGCNRVRVGLKCWDEVRVRSVSALKRTLNRLLNRHP